MSGSKSIKETRNTESIVNMIEGNRESDKGPSFMFRQSTNSNGSYYQ